MISPNLLFNNRFGEFFYFNSLSTNGMIKIKLIIEMIEIIKEFTSSTKGLLQRISVMKIIRTKPIRVEYLLAKS